MVAPVWPDEKGMKVCPSCLDEKHSSEYYSSSKSPTGITSYCKECTKKKKRESTRRIAEINPEAWKNRRNGYVKRYREKNPERAKESDRRIDLKRKYKLSLKDYECMLIKQNNVCAICKRSSDIKGKPLAVDHDHKCCPGQLTCGKCVRGLLCYTCNASLGGLENLLKEAEEYLNAFGDLRRQSSR